MYISVLARTLRPGATYGDFVQAWYPERGFGVPGRGPYTARSIADERQIVAVGIDEVIESTQLRGIYELLDEFDFSSDESVARGRPGG
jgi:hypothetical protein